MRTDLDYEGAMADCHATVDQLAKCSMRTGDALAAWWLCANWPDRVNCYPQEVRDKLVARASWQGPPPNGWKSWVSWMQRPEVQSTYAVDLEW